MVLNTAGWAGSCERAVRGLCRRFAIFAPDGRSSTTVSLLSLRPGTAYNVSMLGSSSGTMVIVLSARQLEEGLRVPLTRGEGGFSIAMLNATAENDALEEAEGAQGALSAAYMALQSAPLTSQGGVSPLAAHLATVYRSAVEDYQGGDYLRAKSRSNNITSSRRVRW